MLKKIIPAIFFVCSLLYADSVKIADKIDIKGLKYLTTNDVAYYSGIIFKNGKITYNDAKVKKYLKNENLIKKYKLIAKNNTISIIVDEKKPEYNLLIKKKSGNRLCVIDENRNIIAIDRIYSEKPLLIIPEEFVSEDGFDDVFEDSLKLFKEMQKRYPVWNQIKSIEISYSHLKIKCFQRETEFTIEKESNGFYKLNSVLAYLDRIEFYPVELNLIRNLTVLK